MAKIIPKMRYFPEITSIPTDFSLFIDNTEYKCMLSELLTVSETIQEFHKANPTENKYEINGIKDPHKYFELFIKLIHGIAIEINISNSLFLYQIAQILKVRGLAEKAMEYQNIPIDKTNIFAKILSFYEADPSWKLNQKYDYLTDYLAENWTELKDSEEMKNLPVKILESVLSSEKFADQNESEIFNWIHELCETKGMEYRQLYAYSYFQEYSRSQMRQCIDDISYNEIPTDVWWQLKERMILPVNADADDEEEDVEPAPQQAIQNPNQQMNVLYLPQQQGFIGMNQIPPHAISPQPQYQPTVPNLQQIQGQYINQHAYSPPFQQQVITQQQFPQQTQYQQMPQQQQPPQPQQVPQQLQEFPSISSTPFSQTSSTQSQSSTPSLGAWASISTTPQVPQQKAQKAKKQYPKGTIICEYHNEPLEGLVYTLKNDYSDRWKSFFYVTGGGTKQAKILQIFNYESTTDAWWDNYNGSGFLEKDAWLSIKFNGYKLCMTHYTLANCATTRNNHQPRKWRIEASNDGNNWVEIETVKTNKMNRPEPIETFKLSKMTEPYSMFKWILLENNTTQSKSNQFEFSVSALELFGVFIPQSYNSDSY